MIVSHKSQMIDRGQLLRRNKQIIMSYAAASMPLVAVAATAVTAAVATTAAAAAGRKQEASSLSATSRRVNEPNAQINRRGRAKIIRDASGDASRLRRRVTRCTRDKRAS